MSSASIRERFVFTAIFNVGKIVISFLSGTLIARALGPENCGNYMFLMGSFLGVRQLLNLETSSAFFTFLCQKLRGTRFILSYLVWQVLQIALTVMLIGIIFPDRVIRLLWINQERGTVLLAFLAVFFSQQMMLTVTQIGESLRKTRRVQGLNFLSAFFQFFVLLIVSLLGKLTVSNALTITIVISFLSFLISFYWIPIKLPRENGPWEYKTTLSEYRRYCSPLVVHTIITFIYTFADKWFLQRYSGARQQALYSVAFQFSVVGLFATDAMINIFWKETAENYASGDRARLISVYERTLRFLFMFATVVSGILTPWAREITAITLGPAYHEMWPVLAVMFFYPIHTTVSHLTTSVFYTTGRTKEFATYGIAFMLVSTIVTYFIVAPPTNPIPGLGLGALGMAFKIVILNMLWAIFQSAWVSRKFSFRFDLPHQILGILVCYGWGFFIVQLFRNFPGTGMESLQATTILKMSTSFIIYIAGLGILFWKSPSIVGFNHGELYEMTQSLYKRLRGQWGKK